MPLGWIDFSKTDRNKALSILELISDPGTLDELGIAPVRDGFANIFFPGTSTIQTRAKYFLIVPYAFLDLENSQETNPDRMLKVFDEIEKKSAELLLEKADDAEGVIGRVAISHNRWVKRTPADIYWSGLRSFGISTYGNLSISECIKIICDYNEKKAYLSRLGNSNDKPGEWEKDDRDAGGIIKPHLWNVSTYKSDWKDKLCISLSQEESFFLKERIISSYPDSMLGIILRKKLPFVFQCDGFEAIQNQIEHFPKQIKDDYNLALDFSHFIYVIRVLYNILVSAGRNEEAMSEWEDLGKKIDQYASVDLDSIFSRLGISSNYALCRFLNKAKELMSKHDEEGMKNEIQRREKELKQSRAKTVNPGKYDPNTWYGGKYLDYRFENAKQIVRDIFDGEEDLC